MKRFYEHVCITRPELTPAQVDALLEKYKGILSEDKSSTVLAHEYWGLKTLAYPIKKHRKAHYLFLQLEATPAAVKEMERRMRIDEDIMRFLNIKVEAHQPLPTHVMRHRERRAAREDFEVAGPAQEEGN